MELAIALCAIKNVHEDITLGTTGQITCVQNATTLRNTRNRVCVQLGHGIVFLCTNDYTHGHGIDCVYK